MKNLNPLKIGKYTFWVSFGIGNLFLFGFLFGVGIQNKDIAEWSALCGYFYLFVAAVVNLVIFLALQIYGCCYKEKLKQSFIAAAILLINIPLAILYVYGGILLIDYFNTF